MDKKITIGLCIDTFFPMIDGVIMVVDNYAKRLAKYANVVVFAPQIPGEKYDDSKFNYKVVRCKSLNLPIVDYALPIPKLDSKFMKELRNSKLDIVHIHSPFSIGKMGINYAKKHNIPVIGSMHSQFKQDFFRATKSEKIASILTKIVIKQFNRCDECWAVNDEVANIFFKEYHYKELPKVMNNATDINLVKDMEQAKNIINEKYNISPNEIVFLFVGRINKLKNIFFIVDSIKILKEKCEFKFKMLSYYYARADLFLFPSLYDSSSIVQIEAASQKTPTLFLEGAATNATVTKDVNGFIVENDAEKYANKIIEIMENKELYNKACENAYKDLYVNWDDRVKEAYDMYIEKIGE